MRSRSLFLALALAFSSVASAQSYPSKPIRIVVGYPPGGSGDFTTRIIADEIGKELGASLIVENKPGAGGSIASEFVAKAAPDGYTILNQGNHAINKNLYKNLTYDDKDFIPVCRVAVGTTIMVVAGNSQFHNAKELIAFAKANPGKLFSASAGFGSAPHLASVGFEAAAGVKFTTIQYKGGGPASQSLLAGDTQVMFATSREGCTRRPQRASRSPTCATRSRCRGWMLHHRHRPRRSRPRSAPRRRCGSA